MEEFSDLIHEPTEMQYADEKKYLIEEKEGNKFNEDIISNNKLQIDKRNMLKLKDFISQRILVLNKSLKELSKEKYSVNNKDEFQNNLKLNKVDYDKFKKGILSLRPSENFGKEEYL